MKNKIITFLLLLLCVFSIGLNLIDAEVVSADTSSVESLNEETEAIDYASTVKLDMTSETLKAEVSIKLHVDGDTVHFNINEPSFPGTLLKARFLAVNTPESTGSIEAYGKTASNFTKEKLANATSIIIESDNNIWNADSTGGRYLVWVWYKTSSDSDYRNLNIEILQNGLAIASNSAQNRYGETCVAAINQAKTLKLYVHSGQPDPNFYYGEAIELDLKGLRMDIASYVDKKVAFEGVVYRDNNQTAYIEEYDEETGIYYGIAVYYGYSASGDVLDILTVGNRVRIVGKVGEFQGTYQVSGLQYRAMKPKDPDNVQKLGDGFTGSYMEVSADDFKNKRVEIEYEDAKGNSVIEEFNIAPLTINSSISMKNLQVVSIYTTDNEESGSNGAMTLTCQSGDTTVQVRTEVLKFSNGQVITAKSFEGKNINVKGMVEYYNGSYQIKVFSAKDIEFNDYTLAEPAISIDVKETANNNEEIKPAISVTGNDEYAISVSLVRPNKRSEKLLEEKGYAFKIDGDGVYTIRVVVEDIYGKKTTLDKTITVETPKPEGGCGGAVVASLFGLTILSSAIYVLRKKQD